jgi:valacyclovir hydrolase
MSWFEHGGSTIYYEENGNGDPVLLLPGWGGSIEELTVLKEALSAKYRVIAADPPGSGKSGPQPRSYTKSYYHDDAQSFLALLERLSVGPAHLVGFSDGGEYELVMAELQPSAVRSVVTWGSAGKLEAPPEMIEMFASVVDNPIEPMKGFSDYLKATYGEANARAMVQSTAKAFREIIAAGGDISYSRAGEITCPALLLTGEQDFIAPPPLVSQMASAIRNGEFMEVKDAGHEVHAARSDWLAQTVADWLAKH